MIAVEDVVPLARGGTAELFTARAGGVRVVVKVARGDRPGAAEVLAAEAAVLASLAVAAAPRLIGRTRIEGRDALVLEHLDLPTLRAVMAAGVPDAERCALAAAVCGAVAQVHAAGVVHADLTPDNILVDRAARAVRLIDFGLAAPAGATLAPLATIAYAAPERQVRGCRALPAVDVYALGVICYELLAGVPPYEGSPGELRVGHAARRVPRVSERAAVPAGVDDAIARAMAKAAEARPADAGALASLLAEAAPARPRPATGAPPAPTRAVLVGFTWTAGAAAVRDAVAGTGAVLAYSAGDRHVAVAMGGDPRASAEQLASALRAAGAGGVELVEADVQVGRRGVPVGAAIVALARRRPEERAAPPARETRTPLIGRERVLAALEAAARRAAGGAAVLATIWGAVGMGKSRVAEAIAERLAQGGFTVTAARAPSIAELVDRVRCDDLEPIERAALEAVAGRRAADGSAAAALTAAPGALRQAAARVLARALAAGRRTAIVVDDAHDADPIVLDALELATMEPAGGVLVIALARPALAVTRPRWSRRAAVAEAIELEPLAGEPGRGLVRALLPATAAVPGAALDRLIERCGGVPLYMIELVGALVRSAGASTPGTRGALPTDRVDVPAHHDLIAWAVADELSGLPADARAVAESLAVAARSLATAELGPLFAALEAAGLRIELDAGVAVADLIAAGLLVERDGALRFRHELVRDAVAARVGEPRRTAIHRAVLASGLALPLAEHAHHAERAGDRPAAAKAWRRAAAAALARHDDLAAEAALGRALACTEGPDAGLLRQRGAARARLGRHDAAAADFAAAREIAQTGGDRGGLIDVLLDEATALDWSMHFEAAAARTDEAAALAGTGEPGLRRARLAMARGRCAWRAGDAGGAIAPLREAIAIADGVGAGGYETAIGCRLMLGFILGARGELEPAVRALDEALAEASARGDLIHAAAARVNRYPIHAARGDAAALRADMAAVASAGRELGIAVTEFRGEQYQALAALWCGDDDAARVHATAARRLEKADAALLPRPEAALVLAELAARTGDRDGAARWHAAARAHGQPNAIDELMLEGLGAWLAGELDLERAARLAERAIPIGEPEAAYQLLELAARAAARRGDPDDAAAAHKAARELPNLPRFMAGL